MGEFLIDDEWSRKCDRKLKNLWKQISYEGRFIFTGSNLLQKTLGIDIILQSQNDDKDITIDTKHIRPRKKQLNCFFLEEESCPDKKVLGWILKEDGWPDYIFYCFWINENECKAYIIPFIPLREWFIKNREKYPLFQNIDTINKTTGRLVPIDQLSKEIKIIEKYIKIL